MVLREPNRPLGGPGAEPAKVPEVAVEVVPLKDVGKQRSRLKSMSPKEGGGGISSFLAASRFSRMLQASPKTKYSAAELSGGGNDNTTMSGRL